MDVNSNIRTKRRRGLSATLTTAFLVISVSAILVAGAFLIYVNSQTQRNIVAVNQQLIANEAANIVANFIQFLFSVTLL